MKISKILSIKSTRKLSIALALMFLMLSFGKVVQAGDIGPHDHLTIPIPMPYTTTVGTASICQRTDIYNVDYCTRCHNGFGRTYVRTEYDYSHDYSETWLGCINGYENYRKQCSTCSVVHSTYQIICRGAHPYSMEVEY